MNLNNKNTIKIFDDIFPRLDLDAIDFNKELMTKYKMLKSQEEDVWFTDNCLVCAIQFFNKKLEKWFINNYGAEPNKATNLNYDGDISSGKYSVDYLLKFVLLAESLDCCISLTTKKDFPLTMSFYDDDKPVQFKLILAPRVDND